MGLRSAIVANAVTDQGARQYRETGSRMEIASMCYEMFLVSYLEECHKVLVNMVMGGRGIDGRES